MADGFDVIVVGAGAAGLAAGIFAAREAMPLGRGLRILLLDGARSIGAKILVSGGGRCNVTNEQMGVEDFHGSKNIIRNILLAFDERATVAWFESMRVLLKREETGKLFPVSDSATSILKALVNRCEELGVRILTDHRVIDIRKDADEFEVVHSHGALRAKSIILSTGGKSLPKTGSDGFGWELAKRLGHTVTPTSPALVPLVLDEKFFHARISGLSHKAELETFINNKLADRRTGSLLWTHFGISGPVAMDASRFWLIARQSGQTVELRCNFLPGESFEQTERWIVDTAANRPKIALSTLLSERLPDRLSSILLHHAGLEPATPLSQLTRDQRRSLIHTLTALPLPVTKDRGWNYAEVTAGGVPLDEIDYRTMESRKTPGLFLAGEILDCDGRIGGFNFQWAWATGHLAGKGAAHRC
jgi:predicted Rossmann fold flavoprotein